LDQEDHGAGKPVVLIHGWPLSGRTWENQVPKAVFAAAVPPYLFKSKDNVDGPPDDAAIAGREATRSRRTGRHSSKRSPIGNYPSSVP